MSSVALVHLLSSGSCETGTVASTAAAKSQLGNPTTLVLRRTLRLLTVFVLVVTRGGLEATPMGPLIFTERPVRGLQGSSLDGVDRFTFRACVMRTFPHIMTGSASRSTGRLLSTERRGWARSSSSKRSSTQEEAYLGLPFFLVVAKKSTWCTILLSDFKVGEAYLGVPFLAPVIHFL